jgi:hypothetical protein
MRRRHRMRRTESTERRREHRREASAPWLQRAVLQHAAKVQTIARARQRHVQETLALLRFPSPPHPRPHAI